MSLTPQQIELIIRLNHPTYTVSYIEMWCSCSSTIEENAPEALLAMGATGYLRAVDAMLQLDSEQEIQKLNEEIRIKDLQIEHLQASLDAEK